MVVSYGLYAGPHQAGVGELAEVTENAVEWSLAFDRLAALTPGQTGYIREVAVTGTVGAFELRGQVDFLLVLWRDGRPRLRLVECKASRREQALPQALEGLGEPEPARRRLERPGRDLRCANVPLRHRRHR